MDFPVVPRSVLENPESVEKLRNLVSWLETVTSEEAENPDTHGVKLPPEVGDKKYGDWVKREEPETPKKEAKKAKEPIINWAKLIKL